MAPHWRPLPVPALVLLALGVGCVLALVPAPRVVGLRQRAVTAQPGLRASAAVGLRRSLSPLTAAPPPQSPRQAAAPAEQAPAPRLRLPAPALLGAAAGLCGWVAAITGAPFRNGARDVVALCAGAGQKRSQLECLQDTYAVACRAVLTSVDLPDDADRAALDRILRRALYHGRLLLAEARYEEALGAPVYPYWPDTIWTEMDTAREWGLTHLLTRDATFALLEQLREESIEAVTRRPPDVALSLEVVRSQPTLQYAVLFLSAALAVLLADMKHFDDPEDAHGAASDAVAAVKATVGFLSSPRLTGDTVVQMVEDTYEEMKEQLKA